MHTKRKKMRFGARKSRKIAQRRDFDFAGGLSELLLFLTAKPSNSWHSRFLMIILLHLLQVCRKEVVNMTKNNVMRVNSIKTSLFNGNVILAGYLRLLPAQSFWYFYRLWHTVRYVFFWLCLSHLFSHICNFKNLPQITDIERGIRWENLKVSCGHVTQRTKTVFTRYTLTDKYISVLSEVPNSLLKMKKSICIAQ